MAAAAHAQTVAVPLSVPLSPDDQQPAAESFVAVSSSSPAATSNTQEEFSKLQASLREKEALIERLSTHLESALVRLNKSQSPTVSENDETAALKVVRDQLEKQNNALKAKKAALEGQIAELSKKSQLLDLENRQLFEALNGKPYRHDEGKMKPARNDSRATKEDSLALEM